MCNKRSLQGWLVPVLLLLTSLPLLAAPPCKGPNKYDPGCPDAEEPAPAEPDAVVESVTVDWFNQVIVVRGSGLSGVTEFLLGGNPTALATANESDTRVDLVFDANLSSEADTRGSYNLTVDGAVALSIYIEYPIIASSASECPCEADWDNELGSLWGTHVTPCPEIEGTGSNDIADIGAEILSDPLDATVYPHYFAGASFYPGVPADSYCTLVQLNGDATTAELVRSQINENQQSDCADALKDNVCVLP